MGELKLTLEEMRTEIDDAIRNGISPAAKILWADNVTEGDSYEIEYGACPGSVLLGLEYIDKGKLVRGTLQLVPMAPSGVVH